MNKLGIVPVLGGLIAGGVLVILLIIGRPEMPPQEEKAEPEKTEETPGPSRDLENENRELRDQIRELKRELEALKAQPDPPEKGEKEDESGKEKPDLHTLFFRLGEMGLEAYQGKAFKELARALAEAGKEGRELLMERLRNAKTSHERFFAAALLEELKDPEAIPALAGSVAEDPDDLVRRMAAHALAVIGTDGVREPLFSAMNDDKDWGVRVNSAYGLAKLGDDTGLAMLKKSYLSGDTPPEYRLLVLGGLADVADPTTAPIFREILAESKDITYLLTSIHAVEKMKDKSSLPELQAILNSDVSDLVKEKAEEAIFNIQQ